MYRRPAVTLMLSMLWLCMTLVVPVLHAQQPCVGLTLRDDADAELDTQALCAAAAPWIERGFQVYVFATDARMTSEDEWFAIRDDVETTWGIYDPSDETFARTALGVEFTTDTSRPWATISRLVRRCLGHPWTTMRR